MLRAAGINFKTFLRLPAFCSRGHLTINYSDGPRVKYIALIQGQSIYPQAFVLSLSVSLCRSSRSIRRDSNYCRATHSTLLSRCRRKDFQLITNLAAKLSFTLLPFERNSLSQVMQPGNFITASMHTQVIK